MAITLITFGLLLFIGVPIGFALMGCSFANFLAISPKLIRLIPQRFFIGIDSFTLLAIPFFILAGQLMNAGGVTPRLLKFSNTVVRGFRGGLALANVLISMLFGGITGTATGDTSAIGTVLIPGMAKEGYDLDFSAAVTASSSCLGPIIPPSVIMITYGVVMQVSIGGLFLAGMIPGILLGLGLMIPAYVISVRRSYPKGDWPSLRELLEVTVEASLALVMPIIIIGGILFGIVTPTEVSGIAVIYGAAVGILVYKQLGFKEIYHCILRTVVVSAGIFFLLGAANIISWILAAQGVPQMFMDLFTSITSNLYMLLLLVNVLLLIIGMFVEPGAAVIIFAPVIAPLFVNLGVHPLHIGVIIVLNLIIGLVTPPVGLCLAIACGIARKPLEVIGKALIPFIAAAILVLIMITYIPELCLAIPRWAGYM